MTRRDLKVYVAGPIQSATLLHSLANLENGQMWTARMFQLGFAPFPVFTDASFIQKVRPVPPIQDVYNYSLAWLKVADAMYVIPGWEHSAGCLAEKKVAEELSIPIFFDTADLCAWADRSITRDTYIEEKLSESDD